MYLVNDNGLNRNIFVRKNVLQIFFLAFPASGFIVFLRYLNVKDDDSGTVFFLLVMLPFTLAIILLFVFVTIRMMKRWNHTIREINFETNRISITTFSVLWFRSKVYCVTFLDITIKESNFQWYGKEKREGLTIKIKNSDELYAVKDYFDDFEMVSSKLSNNKP
jgi:hypothetical protein